MAKYKIEISLTAERQLKRIHRENAIRILKAISLLANEPRPHGVKKLSGYEHVYRIRVGDFRVLYEIDEHRILIIILKIGHRREIYRGRAQ
jgi:mRNA interferase RelE/StbE